MGKIDISPSRLVTLDALQIIFGQQEAKADEVLDLLIRENALNERDSALVFELTYGVLRNLNLLDYFIEPFLSRTLKHTPGEILNILRLAVYQNLKLRSVPDFALVNEAVNLAKKKSGSGGAKLVNAVLRRFIESGGKRSLPSRTQNPVRYLEVKYSYPRWLVKYLRKKFGEQEAERFMAVCNQPAPLDLRANILKTNAKALREKLKESGLPIIEGMRYSPVGLRLREISIRELMRTGILEQGLATVQDEGAQLISYLISPKPGLRIIDYCAAPGGKTTHMAELSEDKAGIIALDKNPRRLRLVEENCKRLGITCVKVVVLNEMNFAKIKEEKADAVLVDAPCTSLGTLRRHPELRWKKEKPDIKRLVKVQSKICQDALQLLKEGGVFIYCVCTITEEETTGLIKFLLNKYPQLQLESVLNFLPVNKEELTTSEGYLQTYPHRQMVDAFFAARLRLEKEIN